MVVVVVVPRATANLPVALDAKSVAIAGTAPPALHAERADGVWSVRDARIAPGVMDVWIVRIASIVADAWDSRVRGVSLVGEQLE